MVSLSSTNGILYILLFTSNPFLSVMAVTIDQDLSLTKDEKVTLEKFKVIMARESIPDNYMKEDIYLIRWLRSRNFNLEQARRMLLQNLEWRKSNNMSTIHQEDWSDMQEEYVYFIDTFDKTGRPIVTLKFGEWNIRQAVLTGRGERLTRYLYKALDEVTSIVRKLQGDGKEVTQWISLLDMDGYSLVTHGCLSCIRIYIAYVTAYENYFPGSVHDIILINTPSIFQTVLQITTPLLQESTQNMLHVFGKNKQSWQTYLLNSVDAEQLAEHFGGKKLDVD